MTLPTLAADTAALPPEWARAGLGRPGAVADPVRPTLGVVMLDTRFPRLRGDIGCAETFPFPVRYHVVRGAVPNRVVVDADASLLAPFIAAARSLVEEGATAIATSCGFLALFQGPMQAALDVPVWTSSLLLAAEVEAGLAPGRSVGVVTADAASLTSMHLRAAGARPDTAVEGLDIASAFHRTLIENRCELDAAEARVATTRAAMRLVAAHPEVGAIVLECTNMPPYADAVRSATGLAVYDIITLLQDRFMRPATTPQTSR